MPRDWDEHYAKLDELDFTPAPLLVEVADMLPPGRALDLACGAGRNALYLASLGWQVTALDRSEAALRVLRERAAGLAIDSRVADLEAAEFQIAPDSFELVCDFFYLQRNLFPRIREAVHPGGMFAGQIHLLEPAGPGGHNPEFLLRPGELRGEFLGWKILYYSESPGARSGRPSAKIIARRA